MEDYRLVTDETRPPRASNNMEIKHLPAGDADQEAIELYWENYSTSPE